MNPILKSKQARQSVWWLPPLIMLLVNCLAFYGTRPLTAGRAHLDMSLPLDRAITVSPPWVLVYVGSYVFWVVNFLLIAARTEPEQRNHFFAAELVAKLLCTLCFLLIPTALVRPGLAGDGLCNWVLNVIYRADPPNNLFPSIHCLESLFAWYGLRYCRGVPRWYSWASACAAALVFASVLLTKQHVVVDLPAAVAVFAAGLLLERMLPFYRLYPWLERRLRLGKKAAGTGK